MQLLAGVSFLAGKEFYHFLEALVS